LTAYKTILVAVDIFADCQLLLERALKMRSKDTQVHLVYVDEPLVYGDVMHDAMPQLQQSLDSAISEAFAHLAVSAQVDLSHCYSEIGHPAATIKSKAEALQADLIIIGSHARNGWRRLLGATANAVLHGTSCDVLMVRLHEDQPKQVNKTNE